MPQDPTVQGCISKAVSDQGLRTFEQLRAQGMPYLQAVAIANGQQRQLWEQVRQAQGLG